MTEGVNDGEIYAPQYMFRYPGISQFISVYDKKFHGNHRKLFFFSITQ